MRKLTLKKKKWFLKKAISCKINKSQKKSKYTSFDTSPKTRMLCLEEEYNKTVSFFNEIRILSNKKNQKNLKFNIVLKKLNKISPAACLILAGEIDRLKRVKEGRNLITKDFKKWNHNIRNQFNEMGMIELLNINNKKKFFFEKMNNREPSEIYVKFISGISAQGQKAIELRDGIEAKIKNIIPNKKFIQKGLTEAMTNVSNHAYPDEHLNNLNFKDQRWWMSASYNRKTSNLTLIFYDQGIGIPESFRNNPSKWEYIKNIFPLKPNVQDSEIIKSAFEVGKSSTKEPNRGNGLDDIKSYISSLDIDNGHLKIYSGKGMYSFLKINNTISEKNIENKDYPLQGTLIEWQSKIKKI